MEPKRRLRRLHPVTAHASALHERQHGTSGSIADAAASVVGVSFEQFYASDRQRIGRAVALTLGDVDLAADATDEAFTRAYERWGSIAGGNPGGWIYRVAVNWALSVLRRRRRRGAGVLYEQAIESLSVTDPAVREPAVHAALASLDPKHRSVVVCRHLLGWSVAETAEALHLREGTVKSRLARANQILQSQLHHLRPEEPQP
jgi:RNA polymerase sigma factor (sigma-70 family)